MSKLDLEKLTLWSLALGFALYVYRLDLAGVNLSVLRVVGAVLIVRCVLVVAMRIFGNWALRWPAVVMLVSTFFVFALNLLDYAQLAPLPGLRTPIAAHLFNIVLFIAVFAYLDTERKFVLSLKTYVWASCAALFIGYYAYFFGDIPFSFLLHAYGSSFARDLNYLNVNDGVVRLTGPFYDPNFYGIYLLSVAIACAWLYKHFERSPLYVAVMVVSVFSIFLTESRTALMGLGVAYLCYIGLESRNKSFHLRTLYILGLIGIIVFVSGVSSGRLFDMDSVSDRFRFYETAWRAFSDNVFFGGGSAAVLEQESGVSTAHMVYLSLLGKYGLFGTAIYLVFIFCPLAYAYLVRHALQERYRNLVVYLFVPLAAMYVSYDFMTFLEFEYFLFAIGYAAVTYDFAAAYGTAAPSVAVSGEPFGAV
ncbi:O-antigen ligase family protein [Trinickia dinghuensis]|uniref:O-antigen ligase domain-containing protein n=1 Tax=Trinickia dinghuensis TaxID=2291023 RepID=A0A3D8JTP5_9BURK|nr:O-antigen ligase family protein [Trinickia dinghuensis]RDU96036.1 O-antigen ligase domain-containing protein [Trinickia dinghuensis]